MTRGLKWAWVVTAGLVGVFCVLFLVGEKLGMMEPAWVEERLGGSGSGALCVGVAVVLLLVVDLVLPVPSSIVMVMSGRLLGAWTGGAVSFAGAMGAALIGYWACRLGGEKVFRRLVGEAGLEKVRAWFERYGVYAIVLSRPVPMLTEVLSCLAGLTGFRHGSFVAAAVLGTLPICFVYSLAGAAGRDGGQWVTVWVALGIPALGWLFVRWLKGGRSTTTVDASRQEGSDATADSDENRV